MSHIGLSKSKYAAYCQCPKLLWLSQYRRDEATPDAQAESRMEIGIQVSELARAYFEGTVSAIELYPDGSQNRTAMLKRTQQLIDAVASGRLLILSPWTHEPNKRTITRAECVALNQMAEEISASH